MYIADRFNHRIRKIDAFGFITTIAGTGTQGYNGDNILAINAKLNTPFGVDIDTKGNIYIADRGNERVRMVDENGIITTIAGTGIRGFNGDNIQATNTELSWPSRVITDANGNIYVSDFSNQRVRRLTLAPPVPTQVPTEAPSPMPTYLPTVAPSKEPSFTPTERPSAQPSYEPTIKPSYVPSIVPTEVPTLVPSIEPSASPSIAPSASPSFLPTMEPSALPTTAPTTSMAPSHRPAVKASMKSNNSLLNFGLGIGFGILLAIISTYLLYRKFLVQEVDKEVAIDAGDVSKEIEFTKIENEESSRH